MTNPSDTTKTSETNETSAQNEPTMYGTGDGPSFDGTEDDAQVEAAVQAYWLGRTVEQINVDTEDQRSLYGYRSACFDARNRARARANAVPPTKSTTPTRIERGEIIQALSAEATVEGRPVLAAYFAMLWRFVAKDSGQHAHFESIALVMPELEMLERETTRTIEGKFIRRAIAALSGEEDGEQEPAV